MPRRQSSVWVIVFAISAGGGAVQGQPFSRLVTDFEDDFGQIFFTQVIFRNPSLSPSSSGLDAAIGDVTFLTSTIEDPDFSRAFSGTQSSQSFWGFTDPADPNAWVRLTTFQTANLPNPTVNLGGKIRFRLFVEGFTREFTPITNGSIFLAIGIRETGLALPQGADGGISGTVEWVGVDPAAMETLENPNSLPVGVIPVPTDGQWRQYEFDLPALQASGNVVGFTGDGELAAEPSNWGTLEHLAFTNNAVVNGPLALTTFVIHIDDVEFESPVLDPPLIVTLPEPPRPGDDVVNVTGILPEATLVEVIGLGGSLGTVNPAGAETVEVAVPRLSPCEVISARQSVGAVVGEMSPATPVKAAGNAPVRMAMAVRETGTPEACGGNGGGFDPDAPSTLEFIGASETLAFGVPVGRRLEPTADVWQEIVFDPAVDAVTAFSGDGVIDGASGAFEGLYFLIDPDDPAAGPYTIFIDDVTVLNADGPGTECVLEDFENVLPGDVVTGGVDGDGVANTVAADDDVQVIAVGLPAGPTDIIVSPGSNGVLDTAPDGDDVVTGNHAMFRSPLVAGTSRNLAEEPNVSVITRQQAHTGSQSLKVSWAFASATSEQSVLRLTTNLAAGATLANFRTPNPAVPLTNGLPAPNNIRFRMFVRFEPAKAFDDFDLDLDGDVDLADLLAMQLLFTGTGPADGTILHNGSAQARCADADSDGDIDLADLVTFQTRLKP